MIFEININKHVVVKPNFTESGLREYVKGNVIDSTYKNEKIGISKRVLGFYL